MERKNTRVKNNELDKRKTRDKIKKIERKHQWSKSGLKECLSLQTLKEYRKTMNNSKPTPNNLDEIDQFLQRPKLLKLTEEKIAWLALCLLRKFRLKKPSHEEHFRSRLFQWWILSNIHGWNNINSTESCLEYRKKGNTFKLMRPEMPWYHNQSKTLQD